MDTRFLEMGTSFSSVVKILAAFLTFCVACHSIYFQAWKAANQNPVKALRSE
jgi:ABC-type lipoprotein release transport system permease subunit